MLLLPAATLEVICDNTDWSLTLSHWAVAIFSAVGLSSARDAHKRTEGELASAVQTIADRNAELRAHAGAIAERDQRIAELRGEIAAIEQENASYQEQVLRAYQKIKQDEAMVTRARKAMAIALTVLDDDQGNQNPS